MNNANTSSVINCAHRGARAYEPENTLRAFVRAAGMGANQVELDVRITADGVTVISHDPVIATVPESADIKNITLENLKLLRYKREYVPTLEEAVEACTKNGMSLNIEIKDPDASEQVAALFGKFNLYEDSHVSSFKLEALKRVRGADPNIPLGIISPPGMQGVALNRAITEKFQAVNCYYRTTTCRFVKKAKSNGMKVNVWTVNNMSDMNKFIEWGVNSIITDMPDALSEVLKVLNNPLDYTTNS